MSFAVWLPLWLLALLDAWHVCAAPGIKPALSAWEAVHFWLPRLLTCWATCPPVTGRDRWPPELMTLMAQKC